MKLWDGKLVLLCICIKWDWKVFFSSWFSSPDHNCSFPLTHVPSWSGTYTSELGGFVVKISLAISLLPQNHFFPGIHCIDVFQILVWSSILRNLRISDHFLRTTTVSPATFLLSCSFHAFASVPQTTTSSLLLYFWHAVQPLCHLYISFSQVIQLIKGSLPIYYYLKSLNRSEPEVSLNVTLLLPHLASQLDVLDAGCHLPTENLKNGLDFLMLE